MRLATELSELEKFGDTSRNAQQIPDWHAPKKKRARTKKRIASSGESTNPQATRHVPAPPNPMN
jgi:hypothetical protein